MYKNGRGQQMVEMSKRKRKKTPAAKRRLDFTTLEKNSGNETSPTLSKELYACNNSKAQHLHTQKESQTLTAINEIDESNAESGKISHTTDDQSFESYGQNEQDVILDNSSELDVSLSESEFDPGDESTYSVSSSENESSEKTSFKHSSFSDNYKEKETLDQQLLHENPSTSDSEKKQKVKKKPSRPCLFCGTFQTRLTRHLKTVHRNEKRIKQIACLPVKEQNHEFDLLQKEGIFAHNLKLLNSGKDQANLEMERKSKKIEKRKMKMCTNCKAFLHVRYFYKHVKSCIKATNNEKQKKPNFSSGLTPSLLRNYEQESDTSFTELLNRFLPDEKGKLCQNNQFILSFGQYLHKKHKRRKGKMVENRRIVMQNMRVLAGLYLKFIEAASTAGIHGLRIESMFDRQYIDILKDAIEMLSIDEANELKSGTRLLLGSVLKRVIKIYKGVLLKRKQDAEAEELDKFSIILSTEWVDIFATAEYQIKAKRHELRRPHELPLENDVRIVKDYTTKRMNELLADFEKTKELNMHEYVELRNLAVIKLTFFNARRGGEPSRIQLSEWFDAQTDEWIDKERLHNLSDEEKKRLLENKLVYQGGKGNGLVPVIVTKDLVKVLSILANDQIRLKCGILPSNDFLFPSTGGSEDHVAGYSCIRIVSQNAGVERNLTATKMRHPAATLFANMEMPEADRAFIYKHLGHSEEINKNVYQCPPAVRELTKVGSYLSNLDQNESLTSKEMSSEPNCVSELSVVVQEESTASTSFSCSITQNKSITKKRKETATSLPPNKKRQRDYYVWSEAEEALLHNSFRSYIEDISRKGNLGPLPSASTVREFMKDNPEIGANYKTIRSKIYNDRAKYRKIHALNVNKLIS